MSEQKQELNRRSFVRQSALAGAGFMIVPRHVLGGPGYVAPSDQLSVAAIGAGGRARGVLRGVVKHNKANIVALCDVDEERAKESFKKYKKANRFVDYREMLEQMDAALTLSLSVHRITPMRWLPWQRCN